MKTSFLTPIFRQAMIGMALVVVSLPLIFLVHRALGLGKPPLVGLLFLSATVVLTLAIAGLIGVAVGSARGNGIVAALLGLGLGIAACALVAPLYGGMVVDALTREAAGLVINRETVESLARERALGVGKDALSAAREGRLREELANLRAQAKNAVTPQARQDELQKAREVAGQLATTGKDKGIALVKSGVAQLSAFALLVWALIGPPIGAAWECRRARR